MVLCLRQLRVSETLGNIGEKASADLAADVYARLPDGYHFVQSTGGHTNARGLETTRLHAGQVALLLSQCMSQLAQADWAAAAARPARTLAQLPTDAPVALADGARRGPVPPSCASGRAGACTTASSSFWPTSPIPAWFSNWIPSGPVSKAGT